MTAETATDPLLELVADPADIRALPPARLPELAGEIRAFLVDKVCATGGHLGPNLGAVELTLALHRVFESPQDTLLFDIGHQAYVHKLLTGRRDDFDTLRRRGGLSGYLQQDESSHDWIENSHASTALAYGDGLAKARALTGNSHPVVVVIGDGALTGGMAWEGLNNLGSAAGRPVIVVVNDNGRSYAPTGGSIAAHLAALRAGRSGSGSSQMDVRRNVFTDFGFAYLGPVDGHDIGALEAALRHARALRRPTVVHTVTVKGKGYPPAETDEADCLHAVGTLDPATGAPAQQAAPSWTKVFADALADLGAERDDLVGVTASMLRPVGLQPFAERFPHRVYDVGIAEQHAVTSAAGLAMGGCHPVVAIYATFLNRAFDQVLMDVALHRLPVTFVLDRAGVTGPDGPSHHGMWDLTTLSVVPGMRVAAPRDATRVRELLREATETRDGPTTIRLPKATAGPDIGALCRMDGMDLLHRSSGKPLDTLVVAAGAVAEPSVAAAAALDEQHGIGTTVVDPRWLVPVNPALVHLASRHRLVVTVEDSSRTGGTGAALAQACADAGADSTVINLGLPRAFLPHGSRSELLREAGLDAAGITDAVLRFRAGRSPHPVLTTPRSA
ncbi:1-deoxy-D-xylulose-5-phosphate synthase [Streptomyces sp. CA-250714]|uniref:1-deoxy-D-xylulose-5-phosphate synthase n=1 Tax=Streptomyces sp. CA-250714 TaxID=3240060 RepID=UPI003D8D87A4